MRQYVSSPGLFTCDWYLRQAFKSLHYNPIIHIMALLLLRNNKLCKCNTVVYSLFSACGACQGGSLIQYVFYVTAHANEPTTFYKVVYVVALLFYRICRWNVSALPLSMPIPSTSFSLSP
ncbi:hypothetical protein F5148DRAFT_931130 [Russula earlei]|uniref:Uncharacterized protein n=1 Tax=Russula earlei TaxID=71964 RepID=A0ACC0U950_9AGAM|nr:hypothetical protein F5148DRAFT_931130 [Russula earlei]